MTFLNMSASSRKKYILALDLGTTSVRAMVFDKQMNVVSISQKPYRVFFSCPGCVEQDAEDIWAKTRQVMRGALIKGKVKAAQIEALGISNQRETTVVWNTVNGKPIHPAIVWQDRRTHEVCDRLKQAGREEMIKRKTGLVIDPYFSATKIQWILKHADHRIKKDHLKFGTIDTWIIWKLTNGKVHATDVSNASRTMLFDIRKLEWDHELLRLFRVPESMLPMVVSSSGKIGEVHDSVIGKRIPITGVCGDQQAALFGQACFKKGDLKNTYGTGAFLLMNTGLRPRFTKQPLLTTVAWQINGKVTYALEGSVFSCGVVINWLRDEMKIIRESAEATKLAESIGSSEGVYFVPAFTGLGAPYWNPKARGSIVGITQATKREHLVRAALEGIANMTTDVVETMKQSTGLTPSVIHADGGVSRSDFVMQYQANLTGVKVQRPAVVETTAMGAAMLAGLEVGFWKDLPALARLSKTKDTFKPKMKLADRRRERDHWQEAVDAVLSWRS